MGMDRRMDDRCANHYVGSRGEAPCYQDDGTLLLPQSPVHRDGIAEHQLVRADQGQRIRRLHHRFDTPFYEPDDHVAVSDAASQDRPLRSETRGALTRHWAIGAC